jgi:DNA polymerase-3 subunit alpha (Gram-positive type)
MAGGYEAIKAKLVELKAKKDNKTASNKEEETFDTLLLALEMTARGYSFEMIDIKRSAAINFLVSDDRKKLLIPFGALDSLGESIANSIVAAREKSMFTSKQDVLSRTKMNSTQFEKMNSMGAFGDLPENDQIGLF